MNLDQTILARFDQLIAKGHEIRQTFHYERYGERKGGPFVDPNVASQWAVSSLHAIGRVFDKDSDHYQRLSALARQIDNVNTFEQARGVLQAAKDDYEHDMLFDARTLITAEVFDDFLEQANHLLQNHYGNGGPAAVLAGAVLEDGLRKLCARKDITPPPKATISPMNDLLAKNGVYSPLTRTRIATLAQIRNDAAHGKYDQFTEDDVRKMIDEVRSFMAAHFS